MSDRFANKYRIPSARLREWDYGSQAAYFVTICAKDRKRYFGEIRDKVMYLSDIGKTVESAWVETLALRPDMNLELGAFQLMPNHLHGIIIIGENQYNSNKEDPLGCRDAMHCVSTVNKFGPQAKNLSSIIRGFKASVTLQAHEAGIADFEWQPRFHDHILRSSESFETIQHYIYHNPENWQQDKFYN